MPFDNSAFTRLVSYLTSWLNRVGDEQGLGWPSDWSVVQYDVDRARVERDYQDAVRKTQTDYLMSVWMSANSSASLPYLMSASLPVALLDMGVISRAEAREMWAERLAGDLVDECQYCGVAAPRHPDHTCVGCGAPDKHAHLCRFCGRSQADHAARCLGCGAAQVVTRPYIPRPPAPPPETFYK